MASSYAQRMARLSNRIFGEVYKPIDGKSRKVVQLMSEEPIYQRKYVIDYYPAHPEISKLMRFLRFIGLYRDEHEDFKQEMKRVKKLRGKGRPKKGRANAQ